MKTLKEKTTTGFTIIMKGFPDLDNLIDPLTEKHISKLDVISKRRLVYQSVRLQNELSQISIKKFLTEKNSVSVLYGFPTHFMLMKILKLT